MLHPHIRTHRAREQRGGPVLVKQTFHLWLGWIGQGISSLMRRARPNRFPHRHAGVAWQKKAAWSCTSLHGRNAAIRHPLPLSVRQIMDKRTGFHEYLLQSGADGVWPRWRFPPASFQGSAPRHIKAAALTRCVAAHLHLRCFCISSTLGLFVTFTVRVISTARRTPLVGDLERMPALFIFVQGFFGGTSVMYLHLQPQKGTSS